ncbi:MAG: hypothetical protein DRP80_07490, partial [Candidatus Omnitrophota bacterium]
NCSERSASFKTSTPLSESINRRDFILVIAGSLLFPMSLIGKENKHQRILRYQRGVYINYWYASCKERVRNLIKMMKKVDLNTLVIQLKDDRGIVAYNSKLEEVAKYRTKRAILNLDEVLRICKDEKIYAIAKIDVFKDNLLVKNNPSLGIKDRITKEVWKDFKGLRWANPYNKKVWEYNLKIIKELANFYNFDEISLDYLRFPTDGIISRCDYEENRRVSVDLVPAFLRLVKKVVNRKLLSVNIFGLTAYLKNDCGIGVIVEEVINYVDYICPMAYPSHFAPGFLGYKSPWQHPYELITKVLLRLKNRGVALEKIRPWIQGFSYRVNDFGENYILEQIRAVKDTGIKNWLIWNPAGNYRITLSALSKLRSSSSPITKGIITPIHYKDRELFESGYIYKTNYPLIVRIRSILNETEFLVKGNLQGYKFQDKKGNLLGIILYEEFKEHIEIKEISVHPAYKEQKIGSQLLACVCRKALKLDSKGYIVVGDFQEEGLEFVKKIGMDLIESNLPCYHNHLEIERRGFKKEEVKRFIESLKNTIGKSSSYISYKNPTKASSPLNSKLRQKLNKVIKEIEKINRILYAVEEGVSVFGSAREPQGGLYYNLAKEVGEVVGRDFWIVTGGGPGLMRAVSESGQKTVGLKMELPFEDEENYANLNLLFHYFFARKLGFITISRGFISLPGGFGTLDETFEILSLKKEGVLGKNVSVILMDRDFYKGLKDLIEFSFKKGLIDTQDLKSFVIKDKPQEVPLYLKENFPEKGKRINMRRVKEDIINIYSSDFLRGITVIGSRKIKKDNPYYSQAKDLGRILIEKFNVLHPGLGGVYEAIGKGIESAHKERGKSIGILIRRKYSPSTFMDISLYLNYFFTQKIAFLKHSEGFVFFPGGFKTLDTLFEVLVLIQTKKTRKRKIILVDKDYWGRWVDWIEKSLLKKGYIKEEDLKLFKIMDSNEKITEELSSSSPLTDYENLLKRFFNNEREWIKSFHKELEVGIELAKSFL